MARDPPCPKTAHKTVSVFSLRQSLLAYLWYPESGIQDLDINKHDDLFVNQWRAKHLVSVIMNMSVLSSKTSATAYIPKNYEPKPLCV